MSGLARLHDDRVCALGEGAIWHPERQQLFWFDIHGQKILSRAGGAPLEWSWDEPVSAAGWVDSDTLLVAGASGLWRFAIGTGDREQLAAIEADRPDTRSNDGRADPAGGFWIGTMGRKGETGEGSIYRYFRGEVRRIHQRITTPNSICFSPDGGTAYFSDTSRGMIWRQTLDSAGWPSGEPKIFIDFSGMGLAPDGAVCDARGNVWVAQWGAWRVACHGPDGRFLRALSCGAAHVTCPAFGGEGLRQMFVTSAATGLSDGDMAHHSGGGRTWVAEMDVAGLPERRVHL